MFNKFFKLNCLILLLSSFYLFSTVITPTKISLVTVQKEVKPYVEIFLKAASSHRVKGLEQISDYKILLAPVRKLIKPTFVGYCFYFEKIILLDDKYWEESDENTKQAVLNHELGHCLLGRMHVEVDKVDHEKNKLFPKSIMIPTVIPATTFSSNKSFYEKELFSKKSEFGRLPFALKKLGQKDTALTKDGDCAEFKPTKGELASLISFKQNQ